MMLEEILKLPIIREQQETKRILVPDLTATQIKADKL